MSKVLKWIFRKVLGYFFQGLLFVAPIGITVYIVAVTFKFIDSLLPFSFPGLGIIVILTGITTIGLIVNLVIAQPLLGIVMRMINKMPVVKLLYTSVKDLLSAFVGKEKKFNIPAIVKVGEGIERIGFITQTDLNFLGIEQGRIAVYFPSSYGMLGELCIVDSSLVQKMEAPSSDVLKFVVSGGVSGS